MFCLVRTKFDGKPQAGITFLLLEMGTPGITVKPIITLAGEHEVNQVFFDNVRVLGERPPGRGSERRPGRWPNRSCWSSNVAADRRPG